MTFRSFCVYLFLLSSPCLRAQSGIETEYGKNRIQHHDDFDDWYMYETQNFVTYWYGKARNVGQVSLALSEFDFNSIESILEHKLNDKIEIICYTDISDLKQSNIGIEEVFISRNDRTTVLGNRIFVYFDGDHIHLRKQIREGIGEVYLNSMLYGAGLQGIVQKSIQLKIPDWFREGLIAYLGEEWSPRTDNQVRDLLANSKKSKKFETLARDQPRLMGHAFWKYLTQEYGRSNVSNILYLARINRNIKSSFLYILGLPFDQISTAALTYYKKQYSDDKSSIRAIDLSRALPAKNKKKYPIPQIRVSPDGSQIAYSVNDRGRYKVYIYDSDSKKQLKIFSGGIRNNVQETDYQIPIFAWNPSGKELALVTEKKDIWYLYRLLTESKSIIIDKITPEYQRIYSVDWINDKSLLFSAATDALSDLYAYDPINRSSRRITQDFFDDLDASYISLNNKKGILFKSNRSVDSIYTMPLDTVLPIQPFNLYFLEYSGQTIAKKPLRLSANNYFDIDEPSLSADNKISFLRDENGIRNIKSIQIDGQGQNSLTSSSHYDRDLLSFHSASDKSAFSVAYGKKYFLILKDLEREDTSKIQYTSYRKNQILRGQIAEPSTLNEITNAINSTDEIVIEIKVKSDELVLFQSEFPDPPGIEKELVNASGSVETSRIPSPVTSVFSPETAIIPERFSFNRMVASRVRFKLHDFTTTMDNGLLFGGLNSYAGQKRGYDYPPAGFLVKGEIKDLFEDFVIEGGVRIPTSFNGTEYYFLFDNKKRRIDKRYAIYRQTRYQTEEVSAVLSQRRKTSSLIAVHEWRYPFDTYQSVRLGATMRFDQNTVLATDITNLKTGPEANQRLGLRAEYVYDNTTPIDLNKFSGSRAKIYTELVKKMEVQVVDQWKLNLAKGFMTVMGFDARTYLTMDKKSILALRFSGATSFGSERILFFLGGVDNWLTPKYDNDTPVPSEGNYAYNALGAHLRGFNQNIRNGTSHVLFNTELRIPVIQYIIQRELRSVFLRNLQVVAFADAGTAWYGRNPFDQNSPLNTTTVSNPKVEINLIYARDPLVFGYGGGLRLSLMGYQIRADYAWGLETRQVLPPKFYLSLGADF